MSNIDNLMNKYVRSVGSKKAEDLKKLSEVDVPPKTSRVPVRAACLSIIACIVIVILFAFPRKQDVTLDAIDSTMIYIESGTDGEIGGANIGNQDIKSYLNDKSFSSFVKNILIPQINGIPADAFILKYKNRQIGVRINVDDFLILPGVNYVDAYYIDKNYHVQDFDSYLNLEGKTSYNGYEVLYETSDNTCLLYFENQDVYCCMQIKLLDSAQNIDVSEILKIIFK